MTIPVYFIVQCCSSKFITRVRKKFTAYKPRLGKSTFSHFIAMLEMEIFNTIIKSRSSSVGGGDISQISQIPPRRHFRMCVKCQIEKPRIGRRTISVTFRCHAFSQFGSAAEIFGLHTLDIWLFVNG